MTGLSPLKLVLSVIDPGYTSDVPLGAMAGPEDYLKSMRFAERNGLYYFYAKRMKELGLGVEVLDDDSWQKEEERIQMFRETLTLLNDLSRDHGIDYILIKTLNGILNVPRDVDIFVRREARERMINLLAHSGMKPTYSSIAETKLQGSQLDVDIYTEVDYMGVQYLNGDFLWESQVSDEVFGVECPGLNREADFLLLILHSLFGHRFITLLDFLHLKKAMNETRLDFCKTYAKEEGWQSTYDFAVRSLVDLKERIYHEGQDVRFPYMFDRNDIVRCITDTKGFELDWQRRIFLNISFVQEEMYHGFSKTRLCATLMSFDSFQRLANYARAFVKVKRGDKKSTDEPVRNG